jgi:hypothetical protein
MDQKTVDTHFLSLVMMLASGAWQQMGKVPDQLSGKVERDMSHAQMFIDLLIMLKEKTKSNLSSDEEKMIAHTISELELNYADEIKKLVPTTEKKSETTDSPPLTVL